jgi:hypothetical protein
MAPLRLSRATTGTGDGSRRHISSEQIERPQSRSLFFCFARQSRHCDIVETGDTRILIALQRLAGCPLIGCILDSHGSLALGHVARARAAACSHYRAGVAGGLRLLRLL